MKKGFEMINEQIFNDKFHKDIESYEKRLEYLKLLFGIGHKYSYLTGNLEGDFISVTYPRMVFGERNVNSSHRNPKIWAHRIINAFNNKVIKFLVDDGNNGYLGIRFNSIELEKDNRPASINIVNDHNKILIVVYPNIIMEEFHLKIFKNYESEIINIFMRIFPLLDNKNWSKKVNIFYSW